MAKNYRLKYAKTNLILANKPFASGGEGAIYDIDQPANARHLVAKIIHDFKQNPSRVSKLEFLAQHRPPSANHDPDEIPALIWVEDLILDENNKVVGFVMPRVAGEKLEILCAPQLPKNLGQEWHAYQRSNPDNLRLRLKVCANIAKLVAELHATQQYVLADLKPDNIVIRPDGSVSIVDLDSIEILRHGETLHPATVATPDYTPPEYYTRGVEPGKKAIHPSWDRFSLAVIFYRIMLGIHPFAASALPPYDNLNTLADKIENGLFVHDADKSSLFAVVPPPHRQFSSLDEGLRFAFQRTFDLGHDNPALRVSAEHWEMLIQDSPLMLSNRPLPYSTVNLPDLRNVDWIEAAYDKVYSSIFEAKKAVGLPTKKTSQFAAAAAVLFGGVGLMTWHPAFFVLMAATGVFAFVRAKKGPPAGAPNAEINLAIANTTTTDYKGKSLAQLEEQQHSLFNTRHEIKEKIRQYTAELNILEQIYKKRRRQILQKQTGALRNLVPEHDSPQSLLGVDANLDEKARELMQREQAEIEQHYVKTKRVLAVHPVFGQLKGDTPNQKMLGLGDWIDAQELLTSEERRQQKEKLQEELALLQQALQEDIAETQKSYGLLHEALQRQAKTHQNDLQQYLQKNVDNIAKSANFERQLTAEGFNEIVQERLKTQALLAQEEEKLDGINYQVKLVRDAIQRT